MNFIKTLTLINLIVYVSQSSNIFCSAYCTPNSCSGVSNGQCTACTSPFILSNSTCILDPSSMAIYIAQSSAITANPTATTSCVGYTFHGPISTDSYILLTYTGPVSITHTYLRFIAWFVLYDQWRLNSDYIQVQLNTPLSYYQQNLTGYPTQQKLCGDPALYEWYWRFDYNFSHTDTTSPVVFNISTKHVPGSSYWGIKQYMIISSGCHLYCTTCTSYSNTDCSACNTGYKLSGTTCQANCLPQYGPTVNTLVCVHCDMKCTVCNLLSTNCTACATGYYLFSSNFTCLSSCPASYAADNINNLCVACAKTKCLSCSVTNTSYCYQCDNVSYWLMFDCYSSCPNPYFPAAPNCTQCDNSCAVCTGYPSPCSQCNPGYTLSDTICCVSCLPGYGPSPSTGICLLCDLMCTQCNQVSTNCSACTTSGSYQSFLFISNFTCLTNCPPKFANYLITHTCLACSNSLCLQCNSANLSHCYVCDVSYFWLMYNCYTQCPKGYYQNTTVCLPCDSSCLNCTGSPSPCSQCNTGYTLDNETCVMKDIWPLQNLYEINNAMNSFFTSKWIQQFKKTGIFALFLPGAQLSSTILFHNATAPINMYEGARFWSTFLYFEVPQWQQNGTGTQYIFNQTLENTFINANHSIRLLNTYNNAEIGWRFNRVGYTGYFILDAYVPLLVLFSAWIPIIILNLLPKTHKIYKLKIKAFLFLHKITQICSFYLIFALILSWAYFQNLSLNLYKYLSLSIGIIFLMYFIIYNVHTFYKIIPFVHVQINSNKFNYYVQNYSYFLKDIRFEQYGKYYKWTLSHFFRPYNYQILSVFRLTLILTCLPLFQDIKYGCIACLIFIQLIQIMRFLITWPYAEVWRNFFKLTLQFLLLLTFITYLCVDVTYQSLQKSLFLTQPIFYSLTPYKFIQWFGFIVLFLYNILYIIYLIIQIIFICKYTIRQRIEYPRMLYYSKIIQQYQLYKDTYNPTITGQAVAKKQTQKQQQFSILSFKNIKTDRNGYLKLINTIHNAEPALELQDLIINETTKNQQLERQNKRIQKKNKQKQLLVEMAKRGNLFLSKNKQACVVKVKIQEFQVKYVNEKKYNIKYSKIKDLFMRVNPDINKKYNLLMPERREKQFILNPSQNQYYFNIISSIYNHYKTDKTEAVIIKTFLKVDQSLYEPGEKIPMQKSCMSQQIVVLSQKQYIDAQKFQTVLKGFPVPLQLLVLL